MTKFLKRWLKRVRLIWRGHPGDWMGQPAAAVRALSHSPVGGTDYEPDGEYELIASTPVKNPVIEFMEQLAKGEAKVTEAWLFEGRLDERGKLIESDRARALGIMTPFRVTHIEGTEAFKAKVAEAAARLAAHPETAKMARESKRLYLEGIQRLREAKLLEHNFDSDGSSLQYDQRQYTEYTPMYGGPFNKQLYITDYLQMHSRAFEAKNHNPLAKRIIDILGQYAFGRRFKVNIKDARKKKAWDEFEKKTNFRQIASKFWVKEYVLYGELMIDKKMWASIDPSTVWDIITDPDDISKVYYYYQSYSTAYQQFTGYRVAGAAAGQNVAPVEYIIRQLPYTRVVHIKANCVSQEKRGRSILFPILGWLKRLKDLYNAQVIKEQLQASFIWDDTIEGNQADIDAHVSKYSSMPNPGSVFAHNPAIKRTPMQAMTGAGNKGGTQTGDDLMALIATAVGIPKEFFNVMAPGSGSRVGGLVGAEPFEKVIEDIQADFEHLFHAIAEEVFAQVNLDYEKEDIEFIFPSVTKDTTSETVKNVMLGETQGYISKETAAAMFAGELNITSFNHAEEQKKIDKENKTALAKNPMLALPPFGRFGANGNGKTPAEKEQNPGDAEKHGAGKAALKSKMNTL